MTAVVVPDKLTLDPKSDEYKRRRALMADFAALLELLPHCLGATACALGATSKIARLVRQALTFAFSIQEQQDSLGNFVARQTLGASTAQVWNPAAVRFEPLPLPQLSVDDDPKPWIGVADAKDPVLFTFVRDSATPCYEQACKLPGRQPKFCALGGDIEVSAYQNAWSAVAVYRNRDLVRDVQGNAIPRNLDFVYWTREIRFVSRVRPILQRTREYNVVALSSPPLQPLAKHLSRLMALLVKGAAPGTAQFIRFDAEYAQTISSGLPAVVAPIFLGVLTMATSDDVAAFANNAAAYVIGWFANNTPANGELRITLLPTLSTSRLPLLHMTTLVLARDNVEDIPAGPA